MSSGAKDPTCKVSMAELRCLRSYFIVVVIIILLFIETLFVKNFYDIYIYIYIYNIN